MKVRPDLPKAVVLFSGGLDSTTCVAVAAQLGYEPVLLSCLYGQRHDDQLQPSQDMMERFGVIDHEVARLPAIGSVSSSLTNPDMAVSKDKDPREEGVPNTYVPARNLIFLSLAVSYAEDIGAQAVFIGVNHLDYSGYPDCRPEFIQAFQEAVRVGTKAGSEGRGVSIKAPLIYMTKEQIISLGNSLGVDYSWTSSCYDPVGPEGLACGSCDSCQLRLQGFEQAGLEDPIRYADLSS